MSNKFELVSAYKPAGDQAQAIEKLVTGIKEHKKYQVLLGATGTGKTFTVSNVIAQVNKPTLVFVHNKTLAAQLYLEFKEFFPHNHVEYFVSNFDYYQPEAYIPSSDTYIDKNSTTNAELDMLRMAAINAALMHRDTIIVASVACIYGASNPEKYRDMFLTIRQYEVMSRDDFLKKLIEQQYTRNDIELTPGHFRVRGDVIEIALGHTNKYVLRVEFFDDMIDRISEVDILTNRTNATYKLYIIYPANGYATDKETIQRACDEIEQELEQRLEVLEKEGKLVEKQRLEQRVRYDVDALREFGVCPGIENYSRHLNGTKAGETPYTLFDYLPEDFLLIVDESHVSLPQVRGMYNGDRARKQTLVEYGFRLPSALDNRPLRYEEFDKHINQVIYVSATPGPVELENSDEVIQQIIRPTGLVDPEVVVRSSDNMIDDLISEIDERIARNERVLITALTVRMAEELSNYLQQRDYKTAWLHHEVKTIERSEIIHDLRVGVYDVLIGINLLREGLDIPEVSLIAILDADKEGFLRSETALIQIIGRAARNVNGKVIMYADKISNAMESAISETNRRRSIQIAYNEKHNIQPKSVSKKVSEVVRSKDTKKRKSKIVFEENISIPELENKMRIAANNLDFEKAAQYRDQIKELKKMM